MEFEEQRREDWCIDFVDAKRRRVQIQLSRAGTINVFVDGRQKMLEVKRIFAEGRTIHLNGRKILFSDSDVTVPVGQEELVLQVMELFGKRCVDKELPHGMPAQPGPMSFSRQFSKGALPLCVSIEGARGLRHADIFTKSDPYCTCEVVGKPASKFKTRTINCTLNPTWSHSAEITVFEEGDSLFFSLWDKDYCSSDDHLGHATLKFDETLLPCFTGELRLEDTGQAAEAFLKVRLSVGTACERSLYSALDKLLQARQGDDLSAISRAILEAKAASAPEHHWRQAELVLAARQRLQEADSVQAMVEALRCARDVGLEETHQSRAEDQLRCKVVTALQTACGSHSIPELQAALKDAEAIGLDPSASSAASGVLSEEIRREEADRQKQNALQILDAACKSRIVCELEAALQKVKLMELDPSLSHTASTILAEELAKKRLEAQLEEAREMEELAKKRRDTQLEEARGMLEAACKSRKILALQAALKNAAAAGLDPAESCNASIALSEELAKEDGLERLAVLRQRLVEACQRDVIEELEQVIKDGKEAGLGPRDIERGENRLVELRRLREREAQLEVVLNSDTVSAEEIQQEIKSRRAAGLGDQAVLMQRLFKALTAAQRREALKAVTEVVERFQDVVDDAVESMEVTRDELRDTIMAARRLECPDTDVLLRAEQLRKDLHNKIQDIKGQIRVICRARPMSQTEKAQGDSLVVRRFDFVSLEVTEVGKGRRTTRTDTNLTGKEAALPVEKRIFNFNSTFSPGTQEEVFQECGDLVQSALDGFNITLFAYGQTGAGKTYTMFGEKAARGIAPRTIDELFAAMGRRSDCEFQVSATVLEVYCNDIVDLLRKNTHSASDVKVEAHIDSDTAEVRLDNLTWEQCESAAQLNKVLDRGHRQRSVAATQMNIDSSRSHLILLVMIKITNVTTGAEHTSKVVLCDLAGSERLKKSKSSGQQATEATEINKSLSALGDVISALTQGSDHVPYRNHKLTVILQDSLGGTAKTLMFVNCSPASSNLEETLLSLRWAERINDVKRKSLKKSKTKGSITRLGSASSMRSRSASVKRSSSVKLRSDSQSGDIWP